MRTILLAGLLAVLPSTPAHAEHTKICGGGDVTIPCSATWALSGTCSGEDMWDKWTISSGQANVGEKFIRPWENTPIKVIGYELVKIQHLSFWRFNDRYLNATQSWFMIGSTIHAQSDAMLWLGPGENRARLIWPTGLGNVWPIKAKARKGLLDILDLHGQCFGSGSILMYFTIYYSPHRSIGTAARGR